MNDDVRNGDDGDDGDDGDGGEPVGAFWLRADEQHRLSEADQSASAKDQESADRDQRASDQDQATADRDHAARADLNTVDENAYTESREKRETASSDRLANRRTRAGATRDRDVTARDRDRAADTGETASRIRDERAADLTSESIVPGVSLMRQLEKLRAEAAADRAGAADDRARAASDRMTAARGRARLEAELHSTRLESELHSAHLDQLTGAYRREVGQLALSNEIERARRSDGRFVLAFVDVDGLEAVNDRDGQAAGDHVLESVVRAIRTRLRSFDPVIRYGGDEFVCGLSGTDLAQAKRRFNSIGIAIEADTPVSISVGLAALAVGDTADDLTQRADAAMLEVKARHHAGG